MGLEQNLVTPRGGSNPAAESVKPLIGPEPLEDKLNVRGLTYEQALVNDGFIRSAVWNLSRQNPFRDGYIAFLLKVELQLSARYLVGALRDPDCVEGVEAVLSKCEPRNYVFVAGPLVACLHSSEQRIIDFVVKLLILYGSSIATVHPLVATLDDPPCVEPATKVLSCYGPSEVTVHPLVGALGNPLQRLAARNILVGYSRDALKFIRPPRPSSPLYVPLTEVINAINGQAA